MLTLPAPRASRASRQSYGTMRECANLGYRGRSSGATPFRRWNSTCRKSPQRKHRCLWHTPCVTDGNEASAPDGRMGPPDRVRVRQIPVWAFRPGRDLFLIYMNGTTRLSSCVTVLPRKRCFRTYGARTGLPPDDRLAPSTLSAGTPCLTLISATCYHSESFCCNSNRELYLRRHHRIEAGCAPTKFSRQSIVI